MSVQKTHQIEQSNKIRARNYLDDSGSPAGGCGVLGQHIV